MFVEAARVFAERVADSAESPVNKVRWAFREATSRYPTDQEQKLLVELYQSQLARFTKSDADAKSLLAVGEAEDAGQGNRRTGRMDTSRTGDHQRLRKQPQDSKVG